MNDVTAFLGSAGRRMERRRAGLWAVRGAAVAAAGAVLVQLAARRWPAIPELLLLAAAGVAGGLLAAGGWLRARPSLIQVARTADRCLDGSERLATALELAGRDEELVRHQRTDAGAWARTADPRAVGPQGLPLRDLGVAAAALALTGVLAFLPNPALARSRAQQQAEGAREAAAEAIRAIADRATAGQPGEDPSRRQSLVRELSQAEEALREAETTTAAVAALSRTQEGLHALADPSRAGRASAASAAGQQRLPEPGWSRTRRRRASAA